MISDINKLELDVKWQNLTPGCTIVGSCTAEVFRTEERLSPGHRMCAGCGCNYRCKKCTAWTSRRRRSGYHLCNRVP